jgi:hypothetical protein
MQDDQPLARLTWLITEECDVYGVPRLQRDRVLDQVALRHVIYLLWREFEDYENPSYARDRQRVEDRLTDRGVRFQYCGQSVTGGFDVEEAVKNLLVRQSDIDTLRDPHFARLGLSGRIEEPIADDRPTWLYVLVFTD